MAQVTYTEIRARLRALGYGSETQSTTAEDAAIAAAWAELASEREWSFLQKRSSSGTMTIGSEVVPLPTDLAVPTRLSLRTTSENHVIQQVDGDTVQRRLDEDLPTTTSVPLEWAWIRQTVLVWPRPDRAYSVLFDYIKTPDPADFDATGEALPFLDDRFSNVIVWGAAKFMAYRQRDQVSYSIAKNEWDAAKGNMSASDRRGEPDSVVNWPGWRNLPSAGYRRP